MTNEEAKDMLKAKLKCLELEFDIEGCDGDCLGCEYSYGQGTLREQKEALKIAIEALEKQMYREWIPCSERLPEDGENVIACFCTGTVTELLYEGKGKFRGLYEYPKDVIVAWMPLPDFYKGE